jgi:hypothetical protein
MFAVRSATRANLPMRYAFSLVSEAPVSTAKASLPCADWMRFISAATRSSAASQPISRKPCPSILSSGASSRSGCAFCMYRFTPLGQSLPLLKGKSSHGSKPTTWLSFTLSWMPHCCPQKQQCVFTRRSASPSGCQPSAGSDCSRGPKRATRFSIVSGSFAIAQDPSGRGRPCCRQRPSWVTASSLRRHAGQTSW